MVLNFSPIQPKISHWGDQNRVVWIFEWSSYTGRTFFLFFKLYVVSSSWSIYLIYCMKFGNDLDLTRRLIVNEVPTVIPAFSQHWEWSISVKFPPWNRFIVSMSPLLLYSLLYEILYIFYFTEKVWTRRGWRNQQRLFFYRSKTDTRGSQTTPYWVGSGGTVRTCSQDARVDSETEADEEVPQRACWNHYPGLHWCPCWDETGNGYDGVNQGKKKISFMLTSFNVYIRTDPDLLF